MELVTTGWEGLLDIFLQTMQTCGTFLFWPLLSADDAQLQMIVAAPSFLWNINTATECFLGARLENGNNGTAMFATEHSSEARPFGYTLVIRIAVHVSQCLELTKSPILCLILHSKAPILSMTTPQPPPLEPLSVPRPTHPPELFLASRLH